jgi:NAD(P)-dependent dehydrogenase (short-subunit alcohol dehydrogenase family)
LTPTLSATATFVIPAAANNTIRARGAIACGAFGRRLRELFLTHDTSRGLGPGIARAFAEAGAPVVAVARTGAALAELATTSANIRTEVADAADATVAWSLVDQYEPEVLILVAGANPLMRPLQCQTWLTFSVNWHTEVKMAFTWLREAPLKPLPPGSRVVVGSSELPSTDGGGFGRTRPAAVRPRRHT